MPVDVLLQFSDDALVRPMIVSDDDGRDPNCRGKESPLDEFLRRGGNADSGLILYEAEGGQSR
jgi:hypothetical protein